MTNYRVYFHPSQDSNELPTIMDTRAQDLDAASETARAFLAMLGGSYRYAEVFESWKTLWRSSGSRIVFSANM